MAARCQATYSSTPASLIYAQSWPVPSSHSLAKRYPEKTASNSPKKSLNSPWIYEVKKPKATQHIASPIGKSHTWASSMLNNHYPEWIEGDGHIELDMAKEFKLTLEMFKRLTQQVREVDEQLNLSKKPYTFKHYFKNKDGPGIYRSQLATRIRSFTPEIPMTNQPHEPCDNFGSKKEQQRPQSHLGVHRTSDKSVHKSIPKSKPKANNLSASHPTHVTKSNVCKAEQGKHLKKQRYPLTLQPDSLEARNKNNGNWISSSEFNDEESEDFGYIDPVPADWNERKLEELEQEFCSKKSDKTDAFIVRYLQLHRLQADTLENESIRNLRTESIENLCGLTCESQKTSDNSHGKKLCGNVKHSSKTNVEKTKLGEKSSVNISKKSGKSISPPLHCVSASVFKPSTYETTSKYSKSCFSKYSEGNLKEKQAAGHRKKEAKTVTYSTRRGKCSSAKGVRKISNGNAIHSTTSRQSCSVAVYDIVQLASSFEPPCKDRIKSASRPVTAKSAKSKGLLPGKSCHSQRRFSLTTDQTFRPMTTDTRVPVSKPSSAKARQKSAKKSRRCASSKL